MNDQELSALLRQAGAQSPKPTPRLARQTMQAYRSQFDRPSWLARHWRLAAAATVLAVIGVFCVRPSGGSLLPPDNVKPRVLSSGRMQKETYWIGNGWRMEWCLTVPPDTSRVFYSNGAWLTTSERDRIVFHRYFGDLDTNIWYGYDAVLDPHRPSGKVTFQRPNEHPEEMPGVFYASGARLVPIQNLPTEAFETGQNIAVTLVSRPETGLKAVDYIRIDSIGVVEHLQDVASSLIRRYLGNFLPERSPTRDRYSRPLQNR